MPDFALAMAVHTHPSGATILTITGELDYHTAPRLSRTVEGIALTAAVPLVLDASGLSFCDSIGVSALISAYQRATTASAPFAVAGVGRDLAQILRITGVDRIFGLFENVDQAVAACG
ncbi:STAS domain-containing protein [Kitasatospora sp. NPDC094015]|uniref:STAS domain-containing protein n=1 Tax=Kitasatospora sp. NPDC094015 TaxID=3155205 RepID=UPI0033313386